MKNKEPLFHIVKRDDLPWFKVWGIRLLAILLALVLCSIVTVTLTKLNPLDVFGAVMKGAFGSKRKTWVTMQNTSVLLLIALAVTPAFRMRFWNVGGEGQILMGCWAAAACMILLTDKVPEWVLIVVMTVSSIVCGALWAAIPAYFKAKWNTNDTLFTLMMNYIATQLVACFAIVWENPKGSGTIGVINNASEFGWIQIGNKYLLPIIVALVMTIATHQGGACDDAHAAPLRRALRAGRIDSGRWDQPYLDDNTGRRARIHGCHGQLDVALQPFYDDSDKLPACFSEPRCQRNCHRFQPEHFLFRYSDRHHHLLYHRL